MAAPGRGGGAPGTPKDRSAGNHGGNRGGGGDKRRDADAPRNDRQAQGKDPHRGQPG